MDDSPPALTPEQAPARLCEMAADARAAVLLNAAGGVLGSAGADPSGAGRLGELAVELFAAVDAAVSGEPPEQVEVQVEGGSVYALRSPRWTFAVVARRAALSSLMFFDLRAVVRELEAAG